MPRTAPTVLDRIVGYLSPRSGLKRAVASRALEKIRAYEGASTKDGWLPRRMHASANADHRADAAMLRARARSLVQNNPYARKALDSLVANIIGEGITPESRAKKDATRIKIDSLWQRWQKECDADGRSDFHGLCALAYRAMEQDGEVLLRLRPRLAQDGLSVPLQLQLLEIDYLDSTKNGSNGEGGNIIVSGIEYDAIGRPAAYWLRPGHPGDILTVADYKTASARVSADKIIHLYAPERPGQSRGVSRFAAVIARLRDLAIFEDAELARKQNESLLSVIVSGDAGEFAIPTPSESSSAASDRANTLGELGQLRGGAILSANGQNVTVAQPAAVGGYAEYVRMQLYAIAAGTGVTYEMLTGDLSQVNFSSSRVGQQEFRRAAGQRQWHVLVPRLLQPVWAAFVSAAATAGAIPQEDPAVEWTTPKWPYVNPLQDARADALEVSSGMSSLSEKLRQRGYQPERVYAELGQDYARLKSSGALEALTFFNALGARGIAAAQPTTTP